MSALQRITDKDNNTPLEKCVIWWSISDDDEDSQPEVAEAAAAELLFIRAELTAAQARAKKAEENWHANEARAGRDGLIFMECMKLLGLDVSGTDPEAIPAAIKRLKGAA